MLPCGSGQLATLKLTKGDTSSADPVRAAGGFSVPGGAYRPDCATQSGHAVTGLYATSGLPGPTPRAVAIGLLPEAVVAAAHKDVDRTRRP